MDRYEYTSWHEIKDHVMIYSEPEWDDARVMIWDPINKKELRLVFCGSTRPDDNHDLYSGNSETRGEINFVVYPVKETWWDKVKVWYNRIRIKIIVRFAKFRKS